MQKTIRYADNFYFPLSFFLFQMLRFLKDSQGAPYAHADSAWMMVRI